MYIYIYIYIYIYVYLHYKQNDYSQSACDDLRAVRA